jgi:hypothetical protein
VVGLTVAEKAFSQVPMEQLIQEAKVIEMKISENASKNGQYGLINGVPFASIDNDSTRLQVRYSDSQRTKPISVLMYKNKTYYWDGNFDGKIDGLYIDKNEEEMPTEEEFMRAKLIIMKGGVSQVELNLDDMMHEGKGNNFVFFNLDDNRVYDGIEKEIIGIPESERNRVNESLQKLYVDELKGWSE